MGKLLRLTKPSIIVDTNALSDIKSEEASSKLIEIAKQANCPIVLPATAITERLHGKRSDLISQNFAKIEKTVRQGGVRLKLAGEPFFQILNDLRGGRGLVVLEDAYADKIFAKLSNAQSVAQHQAENAADIERQKSRKIALLESDVFAKSEFQKLATEADKEKLKEQCMNFPGVNAPEFATIRKETLHKEIIRGIRETTSHGEYKRLLQHRNDNFTKALSGIVIYRHLLNSLDDQSNEELKALSKVKLGNWTDVIILAYAFGGSAIITNDSGLITFSNACVKAGIVSAKVMRF